MTTQPRDTLAERGIPSRAREAVGLAYGFARTPVLDDDDNNIFAKDGDTVPILGLGLHVTGEGNVSIVDGNGQTRTFPIVNPPNDIPVAVARVRQTDTTVGAGSIFVYVGEAVT